MPDDDRPARPAEPDPPTEPARPGKAAGDPGVQTDERAPRAGADLAGLRVGLASLLWLLAVLAALVLALGALVVALEMNRENALVDFLVTTAFRIDFGVFKEFPGDNAATRAALVNWGIAAVIYLVLGKLLDRVVRP